MGMYSKQRKKILLIFLLIVCLMTEVIASGVAYATEQAPLDVKVVIENVFSKSGTDADIDETFEYTLTPDNAGDPLPSGASADKYEFSIIGSSTSELTITYNRVGEYIYQVKQSVAEEKTGYMYDKEVYTIKVYIRNNGDTEFSSEVIIQNSNDEKVEAVLFTDSYQPLATDPELVDPPIKKVVSGNPPRDAVFTFRFVADDPGYPMPEDSVDGEKIVYVTGSGETEIGTWSFYEAGTYTYTVSEVNTSESGYIYDTTVYTIKYVVTDIDGQLTYERTINNVSEIVSDIVFTNEYADSPKTGDDTDNTWLIVIIVIAGVVAAGCITYLVAVKKRKKDHERR